VWEKRIAPFLYLVQLARDPEQSKASDLKAKYTMIEVSHWAGDLRAEQERAKTVELERKSMKIKMEDKYARLNLFAWWCEDLIPSKENTCFSLWNKLSNFKLVGQVGRLGNRYTLDFWDFSDC